MNIPTCFNCCASGRMHRDGKIGRVSFNNVLIFSTNTILLKNHLAG